MNTARARHVAVVSCACLSFLAGAACDFPSLRDSSIGENVAAEPDALFLTWQRDPTSTMTVAWQTAQPDRFSTLEYRAEGSSRWHSHTVEPVEFPALRRYLRQHELTGLQPATVYQIRFGRGSRVFSFRTMPRAPNQPLRFVVGGDTQHEREWMEETGRIAARYNPEFVVFGGDLAYDNGDEENFELWHEWFAALMSSLITPRGRVIPILVAIGNHEVARGYYSNHSDFGYDSTSRLRIAPFFYRLFPTSGARSYRAIDFGSYLTLILLDTDHTHPVEGAQTSWLEETLRQRSGVPHVIPIYHVGAYPSVRSFDEEVSQRVRTHWVPLFERYGVELAFENHDHVYKRTHALREGRRSDDGVVYVGDGAWGVELKEIGRDQNGSPAWYLERAAEVRHFVLVELMGPNRRIRAISNRGVVFDEYRFPTQERRFQTCDSAAAAFAGAGG